MIKHLVYTTDPETLEIVIELGTVFVGRLYKEMDGYYVFDPGTERRGYWTSWIMREIADKIDELDKPWDEEIQKTLGELNAS